MPTHTVKFLPYDMQIDVEDGDTVQVISRRGEVTAKASITGSSPPGTVAMTFHFAESPTNELTYPTYDPVAKIPELKVAAVRIKKNGKLAAKVA